jgi:hypothetical protein
MEMEMEMEDEGLGKQESAPRSVPARGRWWNL